MVSERARALHFSSIVVDTHSDQLGWAVDHGEDLGVDRPGRQSNFPKLRAGGVNAQFFAAWVDPNRYDSGHGIQRLLQYFDAMYAAVARHPDVIEIACTASDIRRLAATGKIAAVLCIEGGHAIQDDLAALRMFHRLGARYLTLTWNNTNNWADGILDDARHDGLSEFGRQVVKEMNRLGMIVDISHASVKTFWDALETTTMPLLASHSSAKSICDHARNMSDDQIEALARNGGVACVSFVPRFVSESVRVEQAAREKKVATAEQGSTAFRNDFPDLTMPHYTEIVDHIDHMVRVGGIDHVGIGSDFGVITGTPEGMEDASKFPRITEEMTRRGYSDDDIRKVLGENVLRLMEEVIGQ